MHTARHGIEVWLPPRESPAAKARRERRIMWWVIGVTFFTGTWLAPLITPEARAVRKYGEARRVHARNVVGWGAQGEPLALRCSVCEGSGLFPRFGSGDSMLTAPIIGWMACPFCRGRGYLRVSEERLGVVVVPDHVPEG